MIDGSIPGMYYEKVYSSNLLMSLSVIKCVLHLINLVYSGEMKKT